MNSSYSKMEYSELINMIYSHYPSQQNFLNTWLMGSDIGEAHQYIAELARRGIIRSIITTNFDHYIENALEEKGLRTQVISTDEDLRHSEPLIHCKAVRVYKPHGTLGKGALKNTPKDLEILSPIMENELIRVLSEHGVIVLGYSGKDKGIQTVFNKRDYSYYPLFWVDPQPPEGEIKEILDAKGWTYIQCSGASQFIKEYLSLLNRLDSLASESGSGLTISILKHSLESKSKDAASLYSDDLGDLFNMLKKLEPDFSKHEQINEAIVKQIEDSLSISYDFIEAVALASKYNNIEVINTIYQYFGIFLELYDVPAGFSGTYKRTDFDGYKFLIYEMFVSFIAELIKYDRWDSLGDILSKDLFLENSYRSNYVKIGNISEYIRSLNEYMMADCIKDRFENSDLSKLLSHKEFLEADYFLFMRTACKEESMYNIWTPRSCIYLKYIPIYLKKAESKAFLEKLLIAVGFENNKDIFVETLSEKHKMFRKLFEKFPLYDPLDDGYSFDVIGTRT